MKKIAMFTVAMVCVLGVTVAFTDSGFRKIREFLTGYQEVSGGIPAISTTGNGTFVARINQDESEITYTLSYDDLEGQVTQSHIHFGQRSTAGGISVWLCQTAGTPAPAAVAATTPMCPTPGGSVSGVLTAASVIGPAAAGIEPGAFGELVDAIRAGATYVNVHSTKWPGGEIRSQIDGRSNDDHGHH
jgi:hypothetical protein